MTSVDCSDPSVAVKVPPGHVGLFGYGSLLSLTSAEKTLGRKYELARYPCYLPGWKRVWTSLQPNTRFYFTDQNQQSVQPKNILYLNIRRAESRLNGVVYLIAEQELAEFDRREDVYDRIEISRDVVGISLIKGPLWVYVGKPEYVLNASVPNTEAAVRSTYLKLIGDGLQEMGDDFAREYELSTDPYPPENLVHDFTMP